MTLSSGPNLGVLVYGAMGEAHYNELMRMLRAFDALVQPHVKSRTTTAPPGSPADGDVYIVPASATGAWSGQTGKITRYSSVLAGWEFIAPKVGWTLFCESENVPVQYTGSAWVVFTAWISGSGAPAGGTGQVGQYYLDTSGNGNYYLKTGVSTWTLQGSLRGPAGATGATGATGAAGTNGTNGNTILTTSGAPASGTGVDGDYAIDPAALLIYGPKASGTWPTGVSYRGNSRARPTAALAVSGGVATIDLSQPYEVYTHTLAANITSWVFTNPPASGYIAEIRIDLKQGASTAYTCVSPATAGMTAGGTWVVSSTLGAEESLGLAIDSSGNRALFASGLYA